VVFDEDRRKVSEIPVVIPPYKPEFFIIGGFRFDIDYTKNQATTFLPFGLEDGTGSGGQESGVQIGGGHLRTSGGRTPLTVSLNRINFERLRLDNNNKVISGSFEVTINKFIKFSNAKKALILKKLAFFPGFTKVYLTLNLGNHFTPSQIELLGTLNSPLSFTLDAQGITSATLRSDYLPSVIFYANFIKISLTAQRIVGGDIQGRATFEDGKSFTGQGKLHFSSNSEGAGIIVYFNKSFIQGIGV
jgi:hypothetical protein